MLPKYTAYHSHFFMLLQPDDLQMAGMLDISVDRVAKTRQRLKWRLRLAEEASLMDYVLHA